MATSLLIEEERGTYTGFLHEHNGYHAGTFTALSAETEPSQPAAALARVHSLSFPTAQPVRSAA